MFRLLAGISAGHYDSIAGGSAFKFAIFSRKTITSNPRDTSLACDATVGWYWRFGDAPEAAFVAIREHVVAVAQAARDGRLAEIDSSPLGAVYRWKIAFHSPSRQAPPIPCVYVGKPWLHFPGMPASDSATPQSERWRSSPVRIGCSCGWCRSIWRMIDRRKRACSTARLPPVVFPREPLRAA